MVFRMAYNGESIFFLLKNKLYLGLKGRNIACDAKWFCKKKYISFLGARSWVLMAVHWCENCSGYMTGNMCSLFHDVIITPFLIS